MKYCKKYLILFLLFSFSFINNIYASELDISSNNVVLYNLNDDTLIYEENKDSKTAIASLTKIMTSIVAIEEIDDLSKVVVIKERDFYNTIGYSKAGFKVGDKVTYEDLLYGIILPSGADAVNAIVNNTLGYDKFVKKMNELAKYIGLENTLFSNPIGMDDEKNYSTAKDVATLLKYALNNETFKKVFTTKEYITSNNIKLESTLIGYGKNINGANIIKGAKSGFTKDAGRCLASITTLNDVNYLLVVINSNPINSSNALKDSLTIYNYYNDNYSYQEILNKDTIITKIPIKFSKEKYYVITGNEDIKKYMENNKSADISYEYEGLEEIKYNTKKDTRLGKVNILVDGKYIDSSDVYLESEITYYNILLWGVIGLVIIIIIIRLFKKKGRKKK